MKAFFDKDEQNVVEICDTMMELISERKQGGISKCMEKMDVLKRIPNGTYPVPDLNKTRAKDSRGPKVKEEIRAQEEVTGTLESFEDSGKSSSSEYYGS